MKKIILYGSFTPNMLSALEEKCPLGFETCHVPVDGDLAQLAPADYIVNRGGTVDAAIINAAPQLMTKLT